MSDRKLVVVRDPRDNGVLMTFGPYCTADAERVREDKEREIRNAKITVEDA